MVPYNIQGNFDIDELKTMLQVSTITSQGESSH